MKGDLLHRYDRDCEPNGDQPGEKPLRGKGHGAQPHFTGHVRCRSAIRSEEQIGGGKSFQPDRHGLAKCHRSAPTQQHEHRHRPREPVYGWFVESGNCSHECLFHFPPPPIYFASQSNTVLCHIMEFCGFSTQWFSSGKRRNSESMPLAWQAVNAPMPCESGMR